MQDLERMMQEPSQQRTILAVVDGQTKEGLIRLNQKLSGLSAEIKAKQELLDLTDNEEAGDRHQHLSMVLVEIDKALLGMQELFSMKIPTGLNDAEFLSANEHELHLFRQTLEENLVRLNQIYQAI